MERSRVSDRIRLSVPAFDPAIHISESRNPEQMASATADHPAERSGAPMLWIGVLGPPIVWKLRFWLSYVSVPYACWWQASWLLDTITLVTLAVLGGMGWYAWRTWRYAGRGVELELNGPATRTRFLGVLGMCSSALFFYVVMSEGLANLFVDACV
jgi:hypothetical protein